MEASRFNIPRDKKYRQTLSRDNRRQVTRRFVHRLARWVESRFILKEQSKKKPSAIIIRPAKKTLSTCIMTMNAAHRIGPLLEYMRPLSDEMVVGVDSKSADETYELCQAYQAKGIIDELFIIENEALTCNGGMEALVEHCHGDWVLRLDDDEFPEPQFIQWKDQALATERFTHYKLPRLHLCSIEPMRWINDGYLYPDFQMRLFQNKPELLTFPGAVGHLGIQCAGKKGRLNSINLIHLNLAINPRYKREEKLQKYIIRQNGGWVHPVNEHALLFEDFSYHTEAYRHPDPDFCRLLESTVRHQRTRYEAEYQEKANPESMITPAIVSP